MARAIKYLILLFFIPTLCFAGPQTASSTTGTTMIAQARVYLDEASALKWTDATLLQFINDGMSDIASRTLCYQGTESVTFVANTTEYTPSTNYIKTIAVIVNPATGTSWAAKKRTISNRGDSESSDCSSACFWYEFAGKIGIYPAFTSVTTQTATVYFAKKTTVITAGQAVLTPAVFDRALIYYVVGQAFLADHRFSDASNYLNLYMQEIDRYRKDFVGADNETPDPVH